MKVKILQQVNSHWTDGRHLSASVGTVREADDADKDAVAHLKYLVASGQAEMVKDEPAPVKKTAPVGRTAGSE